MLLHLWTAQLNQRGRRGEWEIGRFERAHIRDSPLSLSPTLPLLFPFDELTHPSLAQPTPPASPAAAHASLESPRRALAVRSRSASPIPCRSRRNPRVYARRGFPCAP